ENVVCGDNVIINDNVQLKNVIIGQNTKISRNIILYSPYKDKPIRIGKHVWLSHGVYGEATGGEISIGDYSVIAHFTTLITSNGPGLQSPKLNKIFPLDLGDVAIGSHCWIGTRCTILPNVFLREGIIVGANSLLKSINYDDWSVYAGTPARKVKVLDKNIFEEN
ncbi:MAG: acyltransferase, partial [Bacteroidota bacterium]